MVIDNLYGNHHHNCSCGNCKKSYINEASAGFSFDYELLSKAIDRIYNKEIDVKTEIEENIFNATLQVFNNAVDHGYGKYESGDPEYDFYNQLRTSNEVYSAFRTHAMQNDIASALIDSKGILKSFEQFSKDVQPITSHHVDRWLRTEYDTAVIRSHQAADWQQFEREKDVLPNLRWMPTTSPEPDPVHRVFWESKVVLPIDHPFWKSHIPGDRWNCKCYLESTDEDATSIREIKMPKAKAVKGIDSNPAFTGELFSKDHPFIANADKGAKKAVNQFLKNRISDIVESLKNKAIPPKIKTYISYYKGMVLASPLHGADELKANLNIANFISKKIKEKVYLLPRLDPCNAVDKNLRSTHLPKGVKSGKSPDFLINGKLYEGKSLYGMKQKDWKGIKNKIENKIKDAKVQAENIILEIPPYVSRKYIRDIVINYLKRSNINRDIWVIHKNKLLKYKGTPK